MLALQATTDAGELRLPLCDATAMTLAAAVVEQDMKRREAMLADALRVDPALAIWAVLYRANEGLQNESAHGELSVLRVANWLAPKLIDLLAECVVKVFDLSKEDRGAFSSLAAESV